jgi:hypothetical protein
VCVRAFFRYTMSMIIMSVLFLFPLFFILAPLFLGRLASVPRKEKLKELVKVELAQRALMLKAALREQLAGREVDELKGDEARSYKGNII